MDKIVTIQAPVTEDVSDFLQALKKVTGTKSLTGLIDHFLAQEKAHNPQAFNAAQRLMTKTRKIKEMAKNEPKQ